FLAFLDHIEMRVERRDLVNLGQREFHLLGERGQVCRRQMPVAILNEMQMLDQKIALPRSSAQQRTHVRQRLRLDLPTLRRSGRAPATRLFFGFTDGIRSNGISSQRRLLVSVRGEHPSKNAPGSRGAHITSLGPILRSEVLRTAKWPQARLPV